MFRYLVPKAFYDRVWDIDLLGLRDLGITVLLVDLDNTLVPYRQYDSTAALREWVLSAKSAGLEICVVSNSRSASQVAALAGSLGIMAVTRAGKPRRGGFRKALSMLGREPKVAAVIGDQVFTDVLGGNRLGCHTILVKPMGRHEFIGTRIVRIIESWVMKRIKP